MIIIAALVCGFNAWPQQFTTLVPYPIRWPPPKPAPIGEPPPLPAGCHRIIGGVHRGEVIACDCLPVGSPVPNNG